MKKVICIILGIITISAFSGCSNKTVYIPPEDCCVVSVPEGFELWNNDAGANFHLIDDTYTLIKGIKREENKRYYTITKNASFSIINFDAYVYDNDTYGQGKVVTGFKVNENILPYSPSVYDDVTLSCDKNTDIQPVYQDFQCVGLVVFVADSHESLWNSVWHIDNFFNADGSVKEVENFYYIIQDEINNSSFPEYITSLPDFKTNFQCNDKEVNFKTATYTVERVFCAEGQQISYCVLNRYNETKYFIPSPAYGDQFPASLVSITIDIRKDYKLTVNFNDA